ncbi:MAG: glucuronyl hydrolase [Flaviaesturariibacter sp.]|nr:glucuronyl hydrolase [Flaviaesturariibacter sp.]
MPMKRFLLSMALGAAACTAFAQRPASPAAAIAQTAMTIWKDSFALEGDKTAKWRYDQGVVLKGIEGLWKATGDARYFQYIQKSMDFYVGEDGSIRGYRPDEYNIDHVNNGRMLLLLYNVTGKEKYRKAAQLLRKQLETHPRTTEGSFWHKKIYTSQVWLDGLYMGQPFYAEYAFLFHEDTVFADIARQFSAVERHTRDPKTGLLYHGWDESREQAWADKQTGRSANAWGRAMGWYGMALVDVLDHFPANHPGRDSIVRILNRFAFAVSAAQDKKSGLWFDVMNVPAAPKNYLEASASSMFVYALAKGVRKGYLPAAFFAVAKKGYDGILAMFVKTEGGQANLHGTVSVSGLGGKPYRDGSVAYYLGEPVIVNDPKGMGAFIQAANEMEMAATRTVGKGKTVLLDNFFNAETRKDASGADAPYHYVWNEQDNGGFSMLGGIFERYGVQQKTLGVAPSATTLKGDVYIIVDPDTEKETAHPHLIQPEHIQAIYDWVRGGGVLWLLGNDTGNVEFTHFNQLAARFGVQFNKDSRGRVTGNQFEMGTLAIPAGNEVFPTTKKVYIKEWASQALSGAARLVLADSGAVVVSITKVGKGAVFAVGDPWFYNEYVDGRKLPAGLENYKAAEDLVRWSISQSKKGRGK